MSLELTVIVVTYNSAPVLPGCLDSIAGRLATAEIIVVDNGSTDDTVALARSRPGVRVIAGHGNVGYGTAANLGAGAASRDLLLIMNPDVSIGRADTAALHRLAAQPAVGLQVCRRLPGPGSHRVLFAAWGWRAELAWWIFAFFLLPRGVPMPRPGPLPGQPRWISGSAFVTRRREFTRIGGFDERFFLYVEDFVLSAAYRAHGLPVTTTGAIEVGHAAGTSSPREEEGMIAYALLGWIEAAALGGGEACATQAAALCLRWLGAISRAGRALRSWPILGARAEKKGASADTVMKRIDQITRSEGPTRTYPFARAAAARAITAQRP